VYHRVQSLAALRSALSASETWELDFKGSAKHEEWWELAKDVAAFANYLGGVILVGVAEESNGARLIGLPPAVGSALKEAYEKAARDKCLPRPLLTVVVLEPPEVLGQCVLAVNVEPVPDQIVGAMFYGTNKDGRRTTSDAWRFPVRIGKDNVSITPDRIPMFMDAKLRRVAIRLSAIPSTAIPYLVWRLPSNPLDESPIVEAIVGLEVDLAANVFRAGRLSEDQGARFSVPLDDVDVVWEQTEGNWRIRVTGWLDSKGAYIANPSSAVVRR
jgi:hypothetical protein